MNEIESKVELSPEEYRLHQIRLQEAVANERTIVEFRRLNAQSVSEFRSLAKSAEEIANHLYRAASHFEDKARAL